MQSCSRLTKHCKSSDPFLLPSLSMSWYSVLLLNVSLFNTFPTLHSLSPPWTEREIEILLFHCTTGVCCILPIYSLSSMMIVSDLKGAPPNSINHMQHGPNCSFDTEGQPRLAADSSGNDSWWKKKQHINFVYKLFAMKYFRHHAGWQHRKNDLICWAVKWHSKPKASRLVTCCLGVCAPKACSSQFVCACPLANYEIKSNASVHVVT